MVKKETYRLQALLRLRDRLKRQAQMELGKAIKKLEEEKERLEELEKEKEELIENWKLARKNMKGEFGGGTVAGRGNVHVNFLRKLEDDQEAKDEEIEDQEQVIEDAEEELAEARKAYIEAAQALQVMEKHKELWQKKLQGALSKREAKEMDQLGQNIHQLRNWRGEKNPMQG